MPDFAWMGCIGSIAFLVVCASIVVAASSVSRRPPKRAPRPAIDPTDPRPHALGVVWLAVRASAERVAPALGVVVRKLPYHLARGAALEERIAYVAEALAASPHRKPSEVLDELDDRVALVAPAGDWSLVVAPGLEDAAWVSRTLTQLSSELDTEVWWFAAHEDYAGFMLARGGAIVRDRFVDLSSSEEDRDHGAPLPGEPALGAGGTETLGDEVSELAETLTTAPAVLARTEVLIVAPRARDT